MNAVDDHLKPVRNASSMRNSRADRPERRAHVGRPIDIRNPSARSRHAPSPTHRRRSVGDRIKPARAVRMRDAADSTATGRRRAVKALAIDLSSELPPTATIHPSGTDRSHGLSRDRRCRGYLPSNAWAATSQSALNVRKGGCSSDDGRCLNEPGKDGLTKRLRAAGVILARWSQSS